MMPTCFAETPPHPTGFIQVGESSHDEEKEGQGFNMFQPTNNARKDGETSALRLSELTPSRTQARAQGWRHEQNEIRTSRMSAA